MNTTSFGLPEGVYKGLSYTDESPIGHGELELSASEQGLNIRMATGLTIQKVSISVNELVIMEPARVSTLFQAGTDSQRDALSGKIIGIGRAQGDGKALGLFTPKNLEMDTIADRVRRFLKMDTASLLYFAFDSSWGIPPAQLFGPTKAQHDTFKRLVNNLLRDKNYFPQLEHNGRMPPEYYSQRK